MVHTFEEVRTHTPAEPNEAAPEAIMPQAAWQALLHDAVQSRRPPYTPKILRQWLQATHPQGLGHRRPPPNRPPSHRGGEGHGQGEGKGQQGTLRQGSTEGQAPIGTGHRKRHNVGAANHPSTRKGQEREPKHRGRGHHSRRRDPHQGRAYHDEGTSAAPPPANAARLPGKHTPNTQRQSKNRTPYGSHQPTPTSHRKPHRGWRAHLHGENRG